MGILLLKSRLFTAKSLSPVADSHDSCHLRRDILAFKLLRH